MTSARAKYRLEAEDKTKSAFDSVEKRAGDVAKAVAGIGVAATAAAAGGWAAMYAQGSKNLDMLAKSADALQINTERLAGYRLAAEEIAGITEGQLDNAFKTMNKNVGDFAMGAGRAKAALEALGFTQQQLAGMTTDETFQAISASLRDMEAGAERTAMATRIFGSDADRMLAIIDAGPEKVEELQRAAQDLGLAVSRVDAAKVEAANDAMNRAGKIATGLGNAIAVSTAPIVDDLANRFLGVAKEAGGFGEITDKVMRHVVRAVGYAGNAVRGLQMTWEFLKVITNDTAATIIEGIDQIAGRVAGFINWLPGVEITVGEKMGEIAAGLRSVADEARDNLAELASRPLPLEQLEEWHAEVLERAQINAEQVAAANKAKNLAIIENERETQDALADLHEEYNDEARQRDQRKFSSSLQAGARHNKALFNMNQVARISEGAADLRASVISSYRFGASIGGPPVGALMAGIAGLAQGAHLAALASASFGGGASGAGGGGSSGMGAAMTAQNNPMQPESEPRMVHDYRVQRRGRRGWTDDEVEELWGEFQRYAKNGTVGSVAFLDDF